MNLSNKRKCTGEIIVKSVHIGDDTANTWLKLCDNIAQMFNYQRGDVVKFKGLRSNVFDNTPELLCQKSSCIFPVPNCPRKRKLQRWYQQSYNI